MDDLSNDREKILFYLRDKGESKSNEIAKALEDLDQDAVNYRLKQLKNLGFVMTYKDREDTPKGGRRPVNIHSPNLNKIDNYVDEFGRLSVPQYKIAEIWDENESRLETAEQSIDSNEQKINEVVSRLSELEKENQKLREDVQELESEVSYMRDWMKIAKKHLTAIRMYVQTDVDINHYLDKAEDKLNT